MAKNLRIQLPKSAQKMAMVGLPILVEVIFLKVNLF